MFNQARKLVLGCAILVVLMVLARGAFAQSTPATPDMKNVTVQSGGTAVIAPVTVNVPRQSAPVVNVAPPVVNVAAPTVNVPDELKIKITDSPYLYGDMNVAVTSVPEQPSWCIRNLGWCGLLGAAIIGASVGVADAAGAFDNNVTFK